MHNLSAQLIKLFLNVQVDIKLLDWDTWASIQPDTTAADFIF